MSPNGRMSCCDATTEATDGDDKMNSVAEYRYYFVLMLENMKYSFPFVVVDDPPYEKNNT